VISLTDDIVITKKLKYFSEINNLLVDDDSDYYCDKDKYAPIYKNLKINQLGYQEKKYNTDGCIYEDGLLYDNTRNGSGVIHGWLKDIGLVSGTYIKSQDGIKIPYEPMNIDKINGYYQDEKNLTIEKTFKNKRNPIFHDLIKYMEDDPKTNQKMKWFLKMCYGFSVGVIMGHDGMEVKYKMKRLKVFTVVPEKRDLQRAHLYDIIKIFSSLGFTHSDIKPSNIMMDDDDMPWIIDLDNLFATMYGRRLESDSRFYKFNKPPTFEERYQYDYAMVRGLVP
jgi:hypothetical protein